MPIGLGLVIMTAGFVINQSNVALCGGMFFFLSALIMVTRQQTVFFQRTFCWRG
jgi:hypothetical protein